MTPRASPTPPAPEQEYIITNFQLKQLQDFASLEFVCQAIRSRPITPPAGAPASSIVKTSPLPRVIPPLPEGDTKDLKVWKGYWKQHDLTVATAAKAEMLEKLQAKINQKREEFATAAIQSRKQGYAAMPKRTVELKLVEGWLDALRSTPTTPSTQEREQS